MLRAIMFAGALALTTSCAGLLELGGKSGKTGERVTDRGDEAREAAGGGRPGKTPTVETSDDDPRGIQNAAAELDKMEAALEKEDLVEYARLQGFLFHDLYTPDDEVRESSKYKPLLKRLLALDTRFAAMAGGHAPEIMGDGKRSREATEDGLAAAKEALNACERAANATLSLVKGEPVEFLQAYAQYEKKLARAQKVDDRALRYADVKDGFKVDLAADFATCEAGVAAKQAEFEDRPPIHWHDTSSTKECGYSDWVFVALKVGNNQFGPYEIDGVHSNNGVAYPCSKFPRKGKVPGPVMQAVKRDLKVKKGEIYTMDGDAVLRREGLDIKKYVTVRIYSKETEVSKGDCGESDKKVVCEASNSETARDYNHVTHFMARAEHYRKVERAARCKEMLEKAHKTAEEWSEKHDRQVASGDWQAGLKYKTIKGDILSEQKITQTITSLGSKADERALGGWCTSKGK